MKLLLVNQVATLGVEVKAGAEYTRATHRCWSEDGKLAGEGAEYSQVWRKLPHPTVLAAAQSGTDH
jgi:hypothetical protein